MSRFNEDLEEVIFLSNKILLDEKAFVGCTNLKTIIFMYIKDVHKYNFKNMV